MISKNLLGKKFTNLTVVEKLRLDPKTNTSVYLCLCDCGQRCEAIHRYLLKGTKKSCGCLRQKSIDRFIQQNTTINNLSNDPKYSTYRSMVYRCTNAKSDSYLNYGARGITVCDRWLEPEGKGFINFLEDMGERPDGMTLDRINNDGDYEPSNCRWASKSDQCLNRRTKNKDLPRGVIFIKGNIENQYLAHITVKRNYIRLGVYPTKEEALIERRKAEIKYLGKELPY